MDPTAAYFARRIQAKVAELEERSLKLRQNQAQFGVASPMDIPGRKRPFIATADIAMTASTDTKYGSISVSQTGPFLVGALAAFWRETSEARFRPISSHVDNEADGASVNAINFHYSIRTGGVDHQWQSDPMPSPTLFSCYDRPRYLNGPPAIVEPGGTLFIEVTPTKAPDAAGTLTFCFLGAIVVDASRRTA